MNKQASFTFLLLLFTTTLFISCKKNQHPTAEPEVVVKITKPTADFSVEVNTDDKFKKKYTFKGTATNYKNVTWDFGDKSSSTELVVEHEFLNYGSYTVVFTVTDAKGNTDKKELKLTVSDPNKWGDYSEKGQDAFDSYFYNSSENYFKQSISNNGFHYWWSAHALDVKVDAYNRTKNVKYVTQMKNVLRGAFNKNGKKYKNDFYDDMEWWAIACLRAYDATKDVEYKNVAIELWGYIKTGWTDDLNGGILWKKGLTTKNSCSNGPAAIIAARLYQLDKNQDDLNWAIKIYDWEKKYLVNPENGLVWDSYGNFNDGWRFTYNQGTYIGAAIELYTITKEIKYLNDAVQTTNAVVNGSTYNTSGILKGEGTGDGGLFKGIFIRYMIQLIIKGDLNPPTKTGYTDYLLNNAESLIRNATRTPERFYGPSWRTMPTASEYDSSVQLSALMLLEGVNELWRLDFIK